MSFSMLSSGKQMTFQNIRFQNVWKTLAPKVLQKIRNIVCYIYVLIPDSMKLFYEIYSCSSPADSRDILKSSWK